jgi:hypothetical protein
VGGVSNGQGNPQSSNQPRTGTAIVLKFKDSIGDVTAAQVKKMLAPVLDFEKHSASEQYIDTLPPETKQAIKEKKAIEGMDQEAVIMALGRPLRKTRETKDDKDLETWQYGDPPGRVTFVTFAGSKVIQVRDTYAQMGGSVAQIPTPDH